MNKLLWFSALVATVIAHPSQDASVHRCELDYTQKWPLGMKDGELKYPVNQVMENGETESKYRLVPEQEFEIDEASDIVMVAPSTKYNFHLESSDATPVQKFLIAITNVENQMTPELARIKNKKKQQRIAKKWEKKCKKPGLLHSMSDLSEHISYSCPLYLIDRVSETTETEPSEAVPFAWESPKCGCVMITASVIDEENNVFTHENDPEGDLKMVVCVKRLSRKERKQQRKANRKNGGRKMNKNRNQLTIDENTDAADDLTEETLDTILVESISEMQSEQPTEEAQLEEIEGIGITDEDIDSIANSNDSDVDNEDDDSETADESDATAAAGGNKGGKRKLQRKKKFLKKIKKQAKKIAEKRGLDTVPKELIKQLINKKMNKKARKMCCKKGLKQGRSIAGTADASSAADEQTEKSDVVDSAAQHCQNIPAKFLNKITTRKPNFEEKCVNAFQFCCNEGVNFGGAGKPRKDLKKAMRKLQKENRQERRQQRRRNQNNQDEEENQ